MLLLNHSQVQHILQEAPEIVRPAVVDAYRSFRDGASASAHSFLPIPNEDFSRFISLPAYLMGERGRVAGAKWVSNFRGNMTRGERPLNTLLLLSDAETGVPLGCMECTEINLRRTAASAYLAAESCGFNPQNESLGIVGAGELAEAFCAELIHTYGTAQSVTITDIVAGRAEALAASLQKRGINASAGSAEDILRNAGITILATSAAEPWIDIDLLPTDHRLLLHISTDDLPVEYYSRALNITDSVEGVASETDGLGGAIRAGLDRTEVLELPRIMDGPTVTDERPVVYSPFGLSLLDVALAREVHEVAVNKGYGVLWEPRG